jgi:hypothetical protein
MLQSFVTSRVITATEAYRDIVYTFPGIVRANSKFFHEDEVSEDSGEESGGGPPASPASQESQKKEEKEEEKEEEPDTEPDTEPESGEEANPMLIRC